VSPKEDVEIIETELILSDLASVERRIERVSRAAKSGDKELKLQLELLEKAQALLERGTALYHADDREEFSSLELITSKPVLFAANVAEEHAALDVGDSSVPALHELSALAVERNAPVVVISGKVEEELSQLEIEERAEFLAALGLERSGLERLALSGYKLLELISFFTVGPKEAHAWTCADGTLAPQAAGRIHTDFEKGFIRAEVIAYDDFVACNGELGAKEKGKMRVEGKDYVVVDGDVVHFRFNV